MRIDTSRMTKEERKLLVEKILVRYPRQKEITQAIAACHQSFGKTAEPRCMCITGAAGTGKTTSFTDHASKYPRQITEAGAKVTVLSAVIPAPATVKGLCYELLQELGDPMPHKGTTVQQTARLVGLIDTCGVELIILDEFQHFIDRDSLKVLYTISDWLKNLITKTKIPIILVGLPESTDVLKANIQLMGRFSMVKNIEPFRWQAQKDINEFRAFLQKVDDALPLPKSSLLSDPDLAARIFYATDGVTRPLMKLLRNSADIAIENDRPSIELYMLAHVYEESLSFIDRRKENPFNIGFDYMTAVASLEAKRNHKKEELNREKKKRGRPKKQAAENELAKLLG